MSSRAGISANPLTEPYLIVSHYTALIAPLGSCPIQMPVYKQPSVLSPYISNPSQGLFPIVQLFVFLRGPSSQNLVDVVTQETPNGRRVEGAIIGKPSHEFGMEKVCYLLQIYAHSTWDAQLPNLPSYLAFRFLAYGWYETHKSHPCTTTSDLTGLECVP